MKYAGFCTDNDGDVLGYLVVEMPDGWWLAGSHVSSGPTWSKHDIERFRFDGREDASADDTYEWHGALSAERAKELFPPAPQPEGAADRDNGIGAAQRAIAEVRTATEAA